MTATRKTWIGSLGALLTFAAVGLAQDFYQNADVDSTDPRQKPAATTPTTRAGVDVDREMNELSRDHAERRKALSQQYKDKKRALTESDEWKAMSRADRKARMHALKNEYKADKKRIDAEYRTRRDDLGRQSDVREEQRETR